MDLFQSILVFIEGILTFLSPCILPLFPVYLNVLSNSDLNNRKGLIINTVLFMLGISTTFFILGASMSALNIFVFENKQLILFFGGLFIIIMGIFYMGILKLPFLERTFKFNSEVKNVKPITAYILGFTFSFGWTPCVGPMLASIFVMASSQATILQGNLLILIFSLGFMIPFLAAALLSKQLFGFIEKMKIGLDAIKKFAGLFLIVTGIIMMLGGAAHVRGVIFDFIDNVGNYFELNNLEEQKDNGSNDKESVDSNENDTSTNDKETDKQTIKAPNFNLVDQYGTYHNLSDYEDKLVILSFWTSWCRYCKQQMPYIDELYKEYNYNQDDVVILGVTYPNAGNEKSKTGIIEFLNENKYTYPVVFDESGDVFGNYFIQSFPTTYIINKEGKVEGYIPGAMDKETLKTFIEKYR